MVPEVCSVTLFVVKLQEPHRISNDHPSNVRMSRKPSVTVNDADQPDDVSAWYCAFAVVIDGASLFTISVADSKSR